MRFGKHPPRFDARAMRGALATSQFLSGLGSPPPSSNDYIRAVTNVVGPYWGMLGNDLYGCCVEADAGHQLMLRTANTGGMGLPTTDDVLALYTELTGFDKDNPATDLGTSESDACEYLTKTGFLNFKSAGTARIDDRNLDHIRWATQIFGACRIGIRCPSYMMDQFNAGATWDVAPGTMTNDGHDVPLVGYAGDLFYCVSWGKVQAMTKAFALACIDEAHAELYPDWVTSQGTAPSGLDLAAMEARLKELAS